MKKFFKNLFEPTKTNSDTKCNLVKTKRAVSEDLITNKNYIVSHFSNCFDLIMREVSFFNINKKKALVIYLKGLTPKKLIEDSLISKLTSKINISNNPLSDIELLKYHFGIENDKIYDYLEDCIEIILSGNPIIFVDGLQTFVEVDLKSPPERSIQEPSSEPVLRGPKEGFTESLVKNICLIRKKIQNSNLKVEVFRLGEETNTQVAISYVFNIASKKIILEVKKRLKNIDIDSLLDSNYIEEYISDNPHSIFPSIFRTERPDIAAAKLLEGRVLIIVEGSPSVISVPVLFVEFMHSSEDYYIKYTSATLNRFIRYISLFITISLPSMYVALVTFHQELIPTELFISIINSRINVPLPALWECLLMLIAYEIIREAGLRMPKALGQAVSIVGALVLGDAAVKAGIIGTPLVIVIALTAISLFTIPSPELHIPITYVRFILLLSSGFFGLIGFICALLVICLELVSMRSFGIPYMFPLCPFNLKLSEDVILRAPLYNLNKKQPMLKLKNLFINKN